MKDKPHPLNRLVASGIELAGQLTGYDRSFGLAPDGTVTDVSLSRDGKRVGYVTPDGAQWITGEVDIRVDLGPRGGIRNIQVGIPRGARRMTDQQLRIYQDTHQCGGNTSGIGTT